MKKITKLDSKHNIDKHIYNNIENNKYKYNHQLSNQKFKERGVTIMSLVITIIVLLILAGITIKFALDDNGIIKQSRLASEKYQNKALQEQLALNQAEQEIDKASNRSSSGGSQGGSSGNQTTGGNSTSGGSGSGGSENADELKKQIEDLQNEVDSLTDQIQKEQQEKEQLQQQVNDLKKQQNTANSTISDLNNQIKDKDSKISDLTKEKESLESQINTLKSKQATGNATASQVLAGATFSTSAEVGLTGTMVNHSAITTAVSVGSDGNKVYLRTTQGAYLTNATTGYPEICATISDINNATGYKYTQAQYDANYNAGVSAADNRVNTSSASYTNGYNAGYSASTYTIISNRTDRGQLSYTLTKNYKSLFIAANLGYDGTCTYRGGGNIVSIGHVANGARGDSGGPAGGHWCILAIGNATAGSTITITGNYNHFVAAT